jgi:nucleoside-diphosphate-sugar epimerase
MKPASANDDTLTVRPTALVLGANGRFGLAAAQAFAGAGWRVLAQIRRAPDPAMPGSAKVLEIELKDTRRLVAASGGVSVVVYGVNPVYTRWKELLLPMGRMGMDIAQNLGATFMMPGNVYNFGEAMPPVLREDTPQRATTRKGRLRVELEDELARRAPGLRSVVVRAGDFFGSGTGSWFDLAIVKSIARGKLVYPGPLDVPHAWAYLPDLARAFVELARRELARDDLPAFCRLHFAGYTLTGAQLLAALEHAAARLGLAPARGWRHGRMPWGFIHAGGLVVPMWREIAEMSYLWRVPHALDGALLESTIGPAASTDIDAALRETLLALGHGARDLAAA